MSRSVWISTAFVAVVVVFVAARLAGLTMSHVELSVDEAQYWLWAKSPAWGYFSKPPLLAWILAGTTGLCGDGPACIRAPSALAWGVTAVLVFAIGRALYGVRVGVFAGLSALLAPGAAFSSRIASTDAPLLLLWSAALLALVRLRAGGGWVWAVVLGLGLGLGLLAKYAMLYALGAAALAAVFDPPTRRALLSWKGALAGVIALVVIAPNLMWNLGNGLVTARHTAGNALDDGLSPGLTEPLVFLIAQFALAGPVVFAGWLGAVTATVRGRSAPADRVMLAFSLPILLVVTVLAGLGEANANWAAPALIAVFVLGAATLSQGARGRAWLTGGLVLCLVIQTALIIMDAHADRLLIAGRAPYARALGSEALTRVVADRAEAEGVRTVVAETRSHLALMTYYGRDRAITVKAWPAALAARPQDHFQMTRSLSGRETGPVLAVAPCPGAGRFKGWGRVTDLGPVQDPADGGRRTVHLVRLEDPSGPPVRPAPC